MALFDFAWIFRPKECRIYSEESELWPLHSFSNEELCLDKRLHVEVLNLSQQVRFKYRTFRFQNVKTIDQRHQIQCTLKLTSEAPAIDHTAIPECECYSYETCDTAAWSYWSECDGNCKQTRVRNKNASDEETQSRDCLGLCFFDVQNDIDENLKTCSIKNSRSKRDSPKAISRLMNGSSVYPGSLPYVIRLTFQSFDEYHSDSQAGFHLKESKRLEFEIAEFEK